MIHWEAIYLRRIHETRKHLSWNYLRVAWNQKTSGNKSLSHITHVSIRRNISQSKRIKKVNWSRCGNLDEIGAPLRRKKKKFLISLTKWKVTSSRDGNERLYLPANGRLIAFFCSSFTCHLHFCNFFTLGEFGFIFFVQTQLEFTTLSWALRNVIAMKRWNFWR